MARAWSVVAVMMALAAPGAALAEDAVIRIEAKRSAQATDAALARWRADFADVVTFPLPGGWTAIALGPMEAAAARARLAELKAAGKVPADSFVAVPPDGVVLTGTAPLAPPPEVAQAPGADSVPPAPVTEAGAEAEAEAEADGVAEAAPVADQLIVLETFDTAEAARAALERWHETMPEAGVRAAGTGAVVAVGPLPEDVAAPWADVLRRAGLAKDAAVRAEADLGAVEVAGTAPDWPPAPETPADLPPTEEVQRALRWAGHYDGPIDGKPGPKTQEAITLEMALLRLSPDPGTAMARLIERRAEWVGQMGLTRLEDAHTGLSVTAPMDRLVFDRSERALSIYGPKDGSGAALILFSQPGGQQEMLDLTGLVTALGWVPQPERQVASGRATLRGQNDTHLGQAEAWVRDGRAEGFVLIWPATLAEAEGDHRRLAAELADSLTRMGPAANDKGP